MIHFDDKYFFGDSLKSEVVLVKNHVTKAPLDAHLKAKISLKFVILINK